MKMFHHHMSEMYYSKFYKTYMQVDGVLIYLVRETFTKIPFFSWVIKNATIMIYVKDFSYNLGNSFSHMKN